MELVSVAAILLLFVSSLLWWLCWCKRGQTDGLPPGPSVRDILAASWAEDASTVYTYQRLMKMGEKYGGLFTLRVCGKKFVVINDWKTMRHALVGQSDVFAGRPHMYLANRLFGRTDILFIDGPPSKEKRRFTLHHLRNLGVGRTSIEGVILNETSRLVDTIRGRVGRKVLVNGLFFLPVLNILWQMIAGRQFDCEDDDIRQVGDSLKELLFYCHSSVELNFFPCLRFGRFHGHCMRMALKKYERVKRFLSDEVDRHSAAERQSDDEPRDLMDAYLAEMQTRRSKLESTMTSDCYSKENLIGITFDLVQAGLETTASTLEWSLLYMALWPQIQETAHDELDRVIGRHRLPSYADHSLMPYLQATILEIHRFSTVVPMSGPHCTMSATKLAGFTIPERTTVFQNIWAVHHDPDLWGDPEVFRPERFINDDGRVEKPDYFIPFSLGGRKCIGESLARVQLFLFVSSLLQRFSFGYASGEPPPTLKAKPLLTRGVETLWLTAKER